MQERKMLRKNEVLILNLLNGSNYFVNYNIIKNEINLAIKKKQKIYINLEDVFFSFIVVNQIKKHIAEEPLFLKYVVFLNNMPLLKLMNDYKEINN